MENVEQNEVVDQANIEAENAISAAEKAVQEAIIKCGSLAIYPNNKTHYKAIHCLAEALDALSSAKLFARNNTPCRDCDCDDEEKPISSMQAFKRFLQD